MKQCLIYDNSLRFSRAIYGILGLTAFLIHNHWLVLVAGFLMVLGAFSIKLNIPYQLHSLALKKLSKKELKSTQKKSGELNFACSIGGTLFFVGFFLLHFEKFIGFAWILILIMSLLMFLASFTGVCVASLIYALFKKIFKLR